MSRFRGYWVVAAVVTLLAPITSLDAVPIRVTNGLVGEWNMSTVNMLSYRLAPDTSGYNRHGRIHGANPTSYGWMGTSVNLTNDRWVQVPNSSNLNFGTGSFTLAAWIRMSDTGRYVKTIIDNRGSDGRGYAFSVLTGDRLLLQLADETGWTNYSSDGLMPLVRNQWHHVAVSVNRTSWPVNISFYIDGYHAGYATPKMGNINNTNLPFYIGGHKDTAGYRFNDRIDEVFVYNRALPNWEIWNVLNPGKPNYNASYWNNNSSRRSQNNCYNYANNKATNTFAQPGRAAGAQASSMTCAAVHAAALADGLQPISGYPNWPLDFKSGLALVVGHVGSIPDYHWYRLDSDGTWSHKPGGTNATNRDNSGNIITDPRTANRGGYVHFCGFYLAWSDIAEGYGHEHIN